MVDVVMPQMGESLTEGTVTSWLKAEGEEVARDEPLLEIDTDKVSTTIEAPAAGVLSEIVVSEGETVQVGAVLARIAATEAEAEAAEAAQAEPQGHFGGAGEVETVRFGRAGQRAAPRRREETAPASSGSEGLRLAPEVGAAESGFLSPAVLRRAADAGVPLETLRSLEGSGRGGRVTVRDLERWLEEHDGQRPGRRAAPAAEPAPGQAADPLAGVPERYRYTPTDRDERQPMSSVRKRIADHMVWSKRISPHTIATDEMDASALVAYLEREKGPFESRTGVPLTYTTLIGYVTVQVLGEFPWMNAAVVEDEVVVRPYVHFGLAVAVEETGDLVVPVVTDADQLDLETFARRVHDVVTRGRERRLEPRELENGTFTYSNLGAVGGLSGAPIINQPQVAILSTYAIRERPWVVDGEVVARPVMGLSMSSDHRIVDGLMVFRFLARLIDRLTAIDDVLGGSS